MRDPKDLKRPQFDDVLKQLSSKLVGTCEALHAALRRLYNAAGTDKHITIYGESGVGKEACAEFVHVASGRPGRLITVDIPAIADSMLEAELFGHVRGAFTGAQSARQGLLAAAQGGTLFLDEIHTLSIDLQGKLLRTLQEKTIRPVGSDEAKALDVRIVVATNEDLREAVSVGRMRNDFYFRIHAITVALPPLRDRGPDILLLFNHFLQQCFGETPPPVTPRAQSILRNYSWPGNIREMQNVVSALFTRRGAEEWAGESIEVSDLEAELGVDERQLASNWSKRLVDALTRHRKLSVSNMSEMFGCSTSRVYEILRPLRDAGQVTYQGRCYSLAESPPGAAGPTTTPLQILGVEQQSGQRSVGTELDVEVLRLAAKGVSRGELVAAIGTAKRTASRHLTRLANEGYLRKSGDHPHHYYVRTNKVFEPERERPAIVTVGGLEPPTGLSEAARAETPRTKEGGVNVPSERFSGDAPEADRSRHLSGVDSQPAQGGAGGPSVASMATGARRQPPARPSPAEAIEREMFTVMANRGLSMMPVPPSPPEALREAQRVLELIQLRCLPKSEAAVFQILRAQGAMLLNELLPVVPECRSTIHRSLVSLEERGYVSREESGKGGRRWRVTETWPPSSSDPEVERMLVTALATIGISTRMLMHALAWNETRAYRTLTDLVADGVLRSEGKGCRKRYTLVNVQRTGDSSDEQKAS